MTHRPLRIVVVEDYDSLRHAICDVLSKDGHETIGLVMAEDVDDEPARFVSDLYILDVNLPGEDGISLARRIRRSQPDVGIVIVSARNSLDDRVEGYQSGANIYLTKPLSLEELRAVVLGFGQRLAAKESLGDHALTLSPSRLLIVGKLGSSQLTKPEVVLLAAFSRSPQQELEHWQVAAHLGDGEEISKDNLEVKLGRLRKKLARCGAESPAIRVIRGVGYKLCTTLAVLD